MWRTRQGRGLEMKEGDTEYWMGVCLGSGCER